jgi:hypothetical protein
LSAAVGNWLVFVLLPIYPRLELLFEHYAEEDKDKQANETTKCKIKLSSKILYKSEQQKRGSTLTPAELT